MEWGKMAPAGQRRRKFPKECMRGSPPVLKSQKKKTIPPLPISNVCQKNMVSEVSITFPICLLGASKKTTPSDLNNKFRFGVLWKVFKKERLPSKKPPNKMK